MVCEGLVIVDGHRFDERFGDSCQALFNRHATGENAPGVVIIASFASSPAMLKVCVKLPGGRVFLALASPDPLVNCLVADTIDFLHCPVCNL